MIAESVQDVIVAVIGFGGSYLAYRSATNATRHRDDVTHEVIAKDEDLTGRVAYLMGLLDAHGIEYPPE